MKLAVFSDIHGNLTALEAMLADLDTVGEVDQIWCLGDLVAFGARPAECVARVRALAEAHGDKKFRMIGGNTDRYLVTGERARIRPLEDAEKFPNFVTEMATRDNVLNWNLAQLTFEDYQFLAKSLGKETAVPVKGYGWVIGYHGIPGDDEGMLLPDTRNEQASDALLDREARLAIGAHIHKQMDRELENWRIVNIGSVGMSFDMPGKAQWGVFSFEGVGENGSAQTTLTVDLRAVPYDIDVAIADMTASGHPAPEWASKRLKQQA